MKFDLSKRKPGGARGQRCHPGSNGRRLECMTYLGNAPTLDSLQRADALVRFVVDDDGAGVAPSDVQSAAVWADGERSDEALLARPRGL
jgi:hypothetical protein